MITVQNSNSHTVAPQITGMHDTMFFCSYGMEKNRTTRSRDRQYVFNLRFRL